MTPAECANREDIRREIDRLDQALVAMLVERFGYVRRMSEIKSDPAEALVESRVSDVLAHVTALARDKGLDVELARELWTRLMDWNIAWEHDAIASRLKEAGR
jgi:isochorismate pyruvate lyase